ncbi:integral membrane protein [Algisphaera agarilytica]|uniref:Integral membrane protein n=1 Tax=Algisphaera agarilytica TaxID=1385975 RepID=A0A7X0LKM3_9BACT|nr:integral membrane protein [Algisphaera agarilytica]
MVVPSGLMRVLRTVGLIEGVSTLLLFCVAMPMKYKAGMDWAVSYVGMAHGLLFILLWLLCAAAWAKGLPTKLTLMTMIGAILPGGPFFMDFKLKRYETETAAAASHPVV